MTKLRPSRGAVGNVLLFVTGGCSWRLRLCSGTGSPKATGTLPLAGLLGGAAMVCAVAAMLVRRDRVPRDLADQRSLRPVPSWWLLASAVSVVAVAWITTGWLLVQADQVSPVSEQSKAKIDAVRTGLAAGGGVGAAVALLLAFRRQRHHEVVAACAYYDAAERRVTELCTKAADQLGNDKAAARLAGLYSLERLGQNNPNHRQTIVAVVCAYRRMPYQPPFEPTSRWKAESAPRGTPGAARCSTSSCGAPV